MKDLKVVLWDIEKVSPYELNAKIHDEKQVEKIAKSITEFGWDQPIVVDKDGVVIKGHGRRLAAIKLGYKKVPVLVRDDLSQDQVRAARLADNRVAIGNIDTEIFQKELADLNFDLEGIFDRKELEFMDADLGEMDETAFVDDLDDEVEKQNTETKEKIEEADDKEVRVEKALGFKAIKGKDERHIARFMAQIEAESGLPPAEAFVHFVKGIMELTPA
jgi:ParB-like chromosome segregation protein Spo0J